MRRALLIVLFWTGIARAEGDVFGISARPRATPSVGAYLGVHSVAASVARPGEGADWRLTAAWFHKDRFASVHATRSAALLEGSTLALGYRLGASLAVVPVGPFDLGLGAHAALFAGARFRYLSFALGPEVSAEMFVRPFGVRAPLRLAADARAHVGPVDVGVSASAGPDFDPAFFPTGRYTLGVFVDFVRSG